MNIYTDVVKQKRLTNISVFLSFATFSAIVFSLFSPIVVSNADDSVTSKVRVKSNSVVSLTVDTDNLSFSSVPTESGTFSSQSVTATITTNSVTGYELYFSSEDNSTDMTSTGATTVIASDFEGTVTSSTMVKDKWGYSLDNTDFLKIPALSDQAIIKNINHMPSAAEKTASIYIGIKVSTDLQSGTYSKNVKFSAVAHEAPDPPTLSNIRNMQEITPDICDDSAIGETTALTDTRDGNTYTVKKLADGRCWMTQNLRLIDKTISSADSNLPSGESWTIPASSMSGFDAHNTSNAYLDSTYGGYYNFYTATAGWGTNSVASGNAPKDICPKGWRLPTGGSTGEFQTLYNNYNSSALMRGDPNFVPSAYVFNSWVYNHGISAYWSSSVYSADSGYALTLIELGSSSVLPANYGDKIYGYHVRCIARESEPEPPTMQTFDKTTLTNVGDSATLKDKRDGNYYTVKKLADGNVWMTENLRLIDKTISSTDSNLPSGETWTIPASSANGFSAYNTNNAYLDSTYGGYYTFYTATAGWGTTNNTIGNSPKDICPKGWRLPTGTRDGEFQILYSNYNSVALMTGEPGFVFSGTVFNDSVHISHISGAGGYFWSSTANSADYANSLAITSPNSTLGSRVRPDSGGFRYVGQPVRCIAI